MPLLQGFALLLLSAPRSGSRPARPLWGGRKLGAARRFLESQSGGEALVRLLGLPREVLASLASKSVTAPVAMGIAERLGGIPALAAVGALITGLTGALGGKLLFDTLGVRGQAPRGFALGTAAHGIGAARALQVHPDAGAYAGLALGLQALLAALLLPLAARWLDF